MPGLTDFYALDLEHERLTRGLGLIESVRTLDLLSRLLPPAPATVLDIGGGTGTYARALLAGGYAVHLLDLMPVHIERARADATLATLASAEVGDARALPYPDAGADAALLLGPLYHLPDAADRHAALREAHRALQPGGVVLAAAIPRAAALIGDLRHGLDDEAYSRPIRERAYATGHYDNPEGRPGFFTTAYFHHPDELTAELRAAGFHDVAVYAVEGPASKRVADPELELGDPVRREGLLAALRLVERDPSLLGDSAHLLAVGRRA